MRLGLLLLGLAAAGAAAGCASQRQAGVPLIEAESVRLVTDQGPWKPVAEEDEIGGPWRVAHGGFERELTPVARKSVADLIAPAAPSVPVETAMITPPAPKLAIPRRRARKEARPVGKKATKSRALLARDHFLDYPTRIVAQRASVYVPRALAGQPRLTAESVSPPANGRRRAVGNARLVLREFTLEADRIILRVRDDGRPDFQVMARGGVQFVAEVRGNILREQGLKSLLITNDQVVPLR